MDQNPTNQDPDITGHTSGEDSTPEPAKLSDEGITSAGDRLLQAEIEELMAKTPDAPGTQASPHIHISKPQRAPDQPQSQRPTADQPDRQDAIRTYYSDVAGVVRDKQVSMTDIAIAEQRRREAQSAVTQITQEKSSRRALPTILAIIGVVLLVAGIGVLGYLYVGGRSDTETAPRAITHTLVPADHEVQIDVTGLSRNVLLDTLRREIENSAAPIGDVTVLTLFVEPNAVQPTSATTTRGLTSRELIDTLQTSIDAGLLRSIEPEYMLGIHNTGTNAPFLIFRTSFFENAFAGMLRWEPVLANDLAIVATPEPTLPPEVVETATSTDISTTTPDAELPSREERFVFSDTIVANRDVRALMNGRGDIRLLYSFPDKETLIVTNNTSTLVELFDRLTTAHFSE